MAIRLQLFIAVFVAFCAAQVFGQKAEGELVTRKFKVDVGALWQSSRLMTPGPLDQSNSSRIAERLLQATFAASGIVITGNPVTAPTQPNEKAMFLNEGRGELFVRATLAELDEIERIVGQMQKPPPLVSIEVSFVEAPVVEPSIPFRPMPTGFTNVSVLTEKQFREAVWKYEKARGIDIITAPGVTTMSGRQARVGVEETRPELYQDPPKLPRDTAPDADPTPRNKRRLPFPPGFMPGEGMVYGAIKRPIAE